MVRDEKGQLKLLMIVQLTNGLRGAVVSPILALFIHEQGFTLTEIGLLGTAGVLGWFIFEPLMGVFADRLQKKHLISFAIIGSSIVYALYPMAKSFLHFSILAFSLSSVMSAYAISVKALAAELIPPENRGKTYGRYTAVISSGGIVGPIIGGYIAQQMGNNVPFYIAAFLGIVSLSSVFSMKVGEVEVSKTELKTQSLSELVSAPLVGIYTVRAIFLFNMIFRKYSFPIYLNQSTEFSANKTEIGAFLSIVSLSSTLSKTFLGDIIDRIGPKMVMTSSLGFLSITYMILIQLSGIEALYALGLAQGITMAAAELSMMIHLMSLIPKGRVGMVMGLYSEAENVGAIIASPLLGYLYDNHGSNNTIITVSTILLIDAIIAWSTVKNVKDN